MDIGLSWLSDLMRACGRNLPTLVHVDRTCEGVMFAFGWYYRLRPGVYCYWPLIMRPVVRPVVRDTIDLPPVTVPYSSGNPVGVSVSVTVVYHITDIVKALVDTYEFTNTIRDRAMACVVPFVVGRTVDELIHRYKRINHQITKKLQEDLAMFGVGVEEAFMRDFPLAHMYRILGGTTLIPSPSTMLPANEGVESA
jgi:regulator of protease activity HflC (stomatin/prohibitin superfamily)